MTGQDLKIASQLFKRAMELEGFSGYKLRLGEGGQVDFMGAVAAESGGLSSLMMGSDRNAVLQYGSRLWNCAYIHDSENGDGLKAIPIEELSDAEVASTYRALDSFDAKTEIGLALMLARDTINQMCQKGPEGQASLTPVPGFFFDLGSSRFSSPEEIPFETVSDITAFGWRQVMEANRELVLTLGQKMQPEPSPQPSVQP